jgi:uncharacterized tellurite resistance protein B-like protein
MHNYPRNSPHAAARLISLMMIADGHVCRSELDALHSLKAEAELGLPPGGMHLVLQTFCEDLLCSSMQTDNLSSGLQGELLDSLFGDVTDPELRRKIVNFAVATAVADGNVSAGEQEVLLSMITHWNAGADQASSAAAPPARRPVHTAARA